MKDSAKPVTGLSGVARSQSDRDDDDIDIMELLRALWRGKTIIALTTAAAIAFAAYYILRVAEPRYQATVQLMLEVRAKQVVDIESVVSGVSGDLTALNTELEVLQSGRVLGKLVDKLDLTDDPEFNSALRPPKTLDRIKAFVRSMITFGTDAPDTSGDGAAEPADQSAPVDKTTRDRVIARVRGALSAAVTKSTYVYTVSATTSSPKKSARIVNALADIYIDEQIAVKFEATEQAVAWLSERVTELESDLRAKEEKLKNARAETDLINPQALEGMNLQVKDLRDRLQEMQAQAETAGATQTRLRAILETGDRAEAVEATQDATLKRLLGMLHEGDREAAHLFDQRLEALATRAQAERARLDNQIAALEASYKRLQERIDRQSEDLLRIQQMQRETETTRTLYETFLTRLKETAVQRGLQQADSRVLTDATRGFKVAPRADLILALAIFLGVTAGTIVVLIRQFMHNTFRTAEDLEAAAGYPVMGQIPAMPLKARRDLIGYLRDKPTSAAAEAVRNLRTSILLSNIDAPPQVIMSTSSLPGEGKTTQAVALAQNLAGLGKSVLLIEGDIRRRTLNEYFSEAPRVGLITALAGEMPLRDIVIHDVRLGADVLMGQKSRANAADIFSSERFREFLNEARSQYDYVIIDTPPVLVVPDARVIGQHVDATVFAVAWNRTHRGQVMAALREFESVNLRVTALVLSQIDPKGMKRYGYGGKYGAYSSYGKGYYEAG